jgi:5-methylcytosine-specific restriction endonuclease McrA
MPPGWPELRAACLARDGYLCADCGGPATDADHVIPRAAGGPDVLANLISRCGPCHDRRTGRMSGQR